MFIFNSIGLIEPIFYMQQDNLYCIYITLSCITANSAVYILKYDNNNKKKRWLTIYLLKNQCVVFSGILR